jgi:S1-C subfamily serine protease
VYVAVAVVAAGVGAGAVIGLSNNGTTPKSTGISAQQIPSPNGTSAGGTRTTSLNVQSVANKVEPGIVDINSTLKFQNGAAAGTGMVLNSNGLVLTNNHVVDGSTHLSATLVSTGRKYTAKIVGVDPTHDVALIKLQDASGLSTIHVGNSAKVTLGTPVIAIGNEGGTGGKPTVSPAGAITALDRTITASDSGSGANQETLHNMLQTNAPIGQGDSGGALADSAGQVIGMNTAANSQSFGGAGTSMGFAIPINRALTIARQIAAGHGSSSIIIGQSGFIGVGVDNVSNAAACGLGPSYKAPVNSGALVCQSYHGTAGYAAGIRAGDVITAVNGQQVGSDTALTTIMRKYHPGNKVTLTWVNAQGQHQSAPVTLTAGPAK